MRVESRLSWLAVAAGSTFCAAVTLVGADARWLAALGATIVHVGAIPASIPYAAAPSHDWSNVPVLGELVFHGLDALGGDRALILAQGLLVAVMFALLVLDMRAAGASDAARALVLLVFPFAAVSALFVVRAQVLSFPLFALLLVLLRADARAPSRRIWLLVPLIALWSNLHGAVLAGLLVATVYVAFERRSSLGLGVLVAAWAALFLTPALWSTGSYYWGVMHSEPAVSGYGLWAPLSLGNPLDLAFVIVALPLLFLAVRAHPRRWELASLAVLGVSTMHVSRNSIWFLAFVATPAAVGLGLRSLRPRGALLALAWSVPVIFMVAAFARTPEQTVAGAQLRADAARLAAGQPILADGQNAEQLALDGRRVWIANPIDAFDRNDQRLYVEWLRGRADGDALLRRQRVVLVRRDTDPQRRLAHNASFRAVGRDGAAVLYLRAS
jgi:hypothetical protein